MRASSPAPNDGRLTFTPASTPHPIWLCCALQATRPVRPHPEDPVEGFGLAIVEAQLAGLRMLLSRGILDDPLLPTASFRRLALADGPQVWAKAAMELLEQPTPSRAGALAALRQSPFDMDTALNDLLSLHK